MLLNFELRNLENFLATPIFFRTEFCGFLLTDNLESPNVVTCADYFIKLGLTGRKTEGNHWEPPFVSREEMKDKHGGSNSKTRSSDVSFATICDWR